MFIKLPPAPKDRQDQGTVRAGNGPRSRQVEPTAGSADGGSWPTTPPFEAPGDDHDAHLPDQYDGSRSCEPAAI